MIRNRFNPLFTKATDQPAPGATGSPPAPAPAPEKKDGEDEGGGDESDEEEEGGGDEEQEENPPAPDAAAAAEATRPPALSVFERGKLRALGMGQLIQRLEQADGNLAVAQATIKTLTAENATLKAEAGKVPGKLKAAEQIREKEVARAVTNELTSLGLKPDEAPSQTAADQAPDALLDKFHAMKGAEKTQFYRDNKKALQAAEAARMAATK